MREGVVRRFVAMGLLGIGWGIVCDALNAGTGWWLMGLVVLDLTIAVAGSVRRKLASRPPKRVGPPMEWID